MKNKVQRMPFDWIESQQVYELLNMDKITFRNNVGYDLTVASIGNKKYYKLSEINNFLESKKIQQAV